MSALVYHPAYDPYGAILRILRVFIAVGVPLEKGRVRILEFLLLFPEFIGAMSLTASLRSQWKRLGIERRFPYEERPPAVRLFEMMEPTFEAAFQTIVSKGLLRKAEAGETWSLDFDAIPETLAALARSRNEAEPGLMQLVECISREFALEGDRGLKARSGLMEYRYDAV